MLKNVAHFSTSGANLRFNLMPTGPEQTPAHDAESETEFLVHVSETAAAFTEVQYCKPQEWIQVNKATSGFY